MKLVTDNFLFKHKINPIVILITFILSCLIFYFIDPNTYPEITSFKRIIGVSVKGDMDIKKRVLNFYLYYSIMPIVLILIYSFFTFMFSKMNAFQKYNINENSFYVKNDFLDSDKNNLKDVQKKEVKSFFVTLLSVFLLSIVGSITGKYFFSESFFLNPSVTISFCMLVATGLYLLDLNKKDFDWNNYKWIIISSLVLMFFLSNILSGFGIKYVTAELMYVVSFFILYNFSNNFISNNRLSLENIQASFTIFALSPILVSIFYELVNILNQYSIFVPNKLILANIIYTLMSISSFIYYKFSKSRDIFNWEKFYYPILLVTFSLFIFQPDMQITVSTDLYEQANHGLAINDFLKYNKIPLIENFDAHMLSESFFGILYGSLNNDIYGALFTPYSALIYVFIYPLFYFVMSKFYDKDFSFLLTLFLPTYSQIFSTHIGFLGLITGIYALNKNKFYSHLIYWISLVIICIYRIDIGYQFSLASLFAIIFTSLVTDKKLNFKPFIFSFITVIVSSLTIYVSICLIKNIDPLLRLKEILLLLNSNVNWSYIDLSGPRIKNSILYKLSYIFIPLFAICCSMIILLNQAKKIISLTPDKIFILSALFVSYFSNIERGIVRHNLSELPFCFIILWSTSIMFLCISISIIFRKSKKIIFLVTFSLVNISFPVILTKAIPRTDHLPSININSENLITGSVNKYDKVLSKNENFKNKTDRVIPSEKFKARYEPIVNFIKSFSSKDETFIDFTNQSLLYALANKEKPIFVNQSPGLLSGEVTQEYFLDQIKSKENNLRFVLMPNPHSTISEMLRIDTIENSYRYYKISEYIYSKYKPSYFLDSFQIWTKKGLKIKTTIENVYILPKDYELGNIPFIWANYDVKKSYENDLIDGISKKFSKNRIRIDTSKWEKEKGNYLLIETDSDLEDELAYLSLYRDKIKLSTFSFNLKKGLTKKYIIRVSADYNWINNNIIDLQIDSKANLQNANIKILKGD